MKLYGSHYLNLFQPLYLFRLANFVIRKIINIKVSSMSKIEKRPFAKNLKCSNSFALATVALTLILGGCGDDDVVPTPTPVTNSAPSISSPASVSIEERSDAIFYTATASDDNGDTINFSISGTDAAAFTINSTSGGLSFLQEADFEQPGDENGDNIYDLIVEASDGVLTSELALAVTVKNITDTPIRVRRITQGLNFPLYATGAGDNTNRLFVVEQTGTIRIIDLETSTLLPSPFLDVSTLISDGIEQGLLGLAFAPDYATSGLFYVYITNISGNTEVLEFSVSDADPNIADTSSQRIILTFTQPFGSHNGGWIDFGPDGFLYISSGDGGDAGDPFGNGQDTSTLLGAMLRIDPSSDDFPQDPNANYAIPADNPFVNAAGADEIWAYGLRNPFRASFDRTTGDLYIGDVGQNLIEEVDLIPFGEGGLNFGWNIREGTIAFPGARTTPTGLEFLTEPVAEYGHGTGPTEGFSITGGYVHRGSVESLNGQYLFADFVTSNFWSIPVGNLVQGTTVPSSDFIIRTQELTSPDFGAISNPSSFAEDDNGELYIIDLLRGEVFAVENAE